jgi:hypothetical protein
MTMFGLLGFHEIAARRGDGLRPEFLGLLLEQPLRDRLTLISGGLADIEQVSPASDNSRARRNLKTHAAASL